MHPWFSLLLPNLTGYSIVPQRMEATFPATRNSVAEFAKELLESFEFLQILSLTPLPPDGPSYLQFDFWVGRGAAWRDLAVRRLPYAKDVVSEVPARQRVDGVQLDVEMTTEDGISVLISRPRGRLISSRILWPTLQG